MCCVYCVKCSPIPIGCKAERWDIEMYLAPPVTLMQHLFLHDTTCWLTLKSPQKRVYFGSNKNEAIILEHPFSWTWMLHREPATCLSGLV